METGRISKLFQEKRYGKILMQDGVEAHFHEQCLWNVRFDDLTEGQEIDFRVQRTHNGMLASELCRHLAENLEEKGR